MGCLLGYGATTLPALTEALEIDRDVNLAQKEAHRLEKAISQMNHALKA
jgi:N-acetylated-alpha-linked acidic dipeptidase